MSSELPAPDCPPLRVRLLGENLIAFRATSGKVGLIQNSCPHRGASLFFGRNEEEGLRCVYHGWKFDATGACVDMPSEPAESNFKAKVRARAYPCVERNGIIWAYMGPRATPPPLPDIEANMLAGGEYASAEGLARVQLDAGPRGRHRHHPPGLPALRRRQAGETRSPARFDYYNVADRAPRYEVVDTEFGTSYGAYRPAEDDTYYWRIAHFLFPFYTMIPTGVLGCRSSSAPGCRWTTSTRCSGASACRAPRDGPGSRGRRVRDDGGGPARRRGRQQRRRLRVPAGHHRLARHSSASPSTGTTTT